MGISVTKLVPKWKQVELTERSASHQHFLDLWALLGHPNLPICTQKAIHSLVLDQPVVSPDSKPSAKTNVGAPSSSVIVPWP